MTIPFPVQEYAKADSFKVVEGVLQLANPIAWHEDDTQWVIVYEDGRKIFHPKAEKKHAEHDEKASRTQTKQDKKE